MKHGKKRLITCAPTIFVSVSIPISYFSIAGSRCHFITYRHWETLPRCSRSIHFLGPTDSKQILHKKKVNETNEKIMENEKFGETTNWLLIEQLKQAKEKWKLKMNEKYKQNEWMNEHMNAYQSSVILTFWWTNFFRLLSLFIIIFLFLPKTNFHHSFPFVRTIFMLQTEQFFLFYIWSMNFSQSNMYASFTWSKFNAIAIKYILLK